MQTYRHLFNDDAVLEVFANNLKRLMEYRGMTVHELAQAIGVDSVSVYRYLRGHTNVGIIYLVRIADALDTSIDLLAGRRVIT